MNQNLKKKLKITTIYAVATSGIIVSIMYIVTFYKTKTEAIKERNLLNTIEIENSIEFNHNIEEQPIATQENKEEIKQETERMLQVKNLQTENEDIVGWLEIENTKINYPVLQGTDNEYYMNHNYKKEKSKNGSIFLNKDYDWSIPSTNLLIYGHNMQNGEMFEELLKYKDEKFYQEHPIIRFTTDKEDACYEIIAVFQSRVYYQSEKNVFRYYYFIHAETQEEYQSFIENAKQASLYEIEATAEYGDQLMTLSTCSYHTKDGRFAVVARKIN